MEDGSEQRVYQFHIWSYPVRILKGVCKLQMLTFMKTMFVSSISNVSYGLQGDMFTNMKIVSIKLRVLDKKRIGLTQKWAF